MLIALLLAVLAAAPLQDTKVEKEIVLVQAVPKDAFLFAQATHLDALRADFHESAWYGFYQDEEMKPVRDAVDHLFALAEKNAEKKDKGIAAELGFDPLDFLEALHGSIALFGVAQAGKEEPALGILFEPGAERGKFEELFGKLRDKQKETGILSTDEYAGVELSLFESSPKEKGAADQEKDEEKDAADDDEKDEDKSESGLANSAIFDAGGWAGMVAADTRENLLGIVHGMIDRMSGKDPSTGFAASEPLANARTTVSKAGRIEGFVDLSKVFAMIREHETPKEETDRVIDALALDDLRWVYGTADVGRGEKLGAEFSLRLPDDGYLREWIGCLGAFPRDMAGLAPSASRSITLAQIDVWALWQSAWKFAREIDPESTQMARDQMTTALQQMGGLDVEKGFVSQLDGRYMSFSVPIPAEEWRATLPGIAGAGAAPERQTPAGGAATVIGLRDPQAVAGFVKGLLTAIGVFSQVETEEFQGTTLYKLKSGGGAGIEWAFTKKTGVFSQFPTAMRAALRMEGAEPKDSALEVEGFKPQYAAHADACVLGLASTAQSMKSGLSVLELIGPYVGMGMIRGYQEAGGEGEIPNPLAHLPSEAAIDRHFKGTLVTSLTRKSGVLHLQVASQ
jgi:hypothetical protein